MELRENLKKTGLIAIIFLIMVISSIAFYPYLKGPSITIDSHEYLKENNNILKISGTALRAQNIEINGKKVFTNSDNLWTIEIPKRNSRTNILIIATDKFGKTIKLEKAL